MKLLKKLKTYLNSLIASESHPRVNQYKDLKNANESFVPEIIIHGSVPYAAIYSHLDARQHTLMFC